MDKDFLYENAPLVEVIAEIHWMLKPLQLDPQAKIDPHYESFITEFRNYLKKIEFIHVQELLPNFVPLEILPNQPRVRIRSAPDQWPLVQAGPGILTANIVPPYNGWKEFEGFIFDLIDGLYECYPLAPITLSIEKLNLRYIDGFDKRFGFIEYSNFAAAMLGIQPPLSNEFLRTCTKSDTELSYVFESRFQNILPDGSIGKIKIAPGSMNETDALVMEMSCEGIFSNSSFISLDSVKRWFQAAHKCLHKQFDAVTTPALKLMFGKKMVVEL